MTAIPSFTTSAVNRYDLLERMLASIDIPVDRGLVCINGRMEWHGADALDRLAGDWRVVNLGFSSLGWPGTQNFGITRTPDARWWMLANNDLQFEPGALADWATRMDAAGNDPLVLTHRWAAWTLNAAVVERVGLLDEWSFWPLYFDDTDYAYRCHLAGIPIVQMGGVAEGDEDHPNGLTTASDDRLRDASRKTWIINQAAYVAKWGGRPGRETFKTPWNLDLPLWATRPSMAGRVEREWPS